MLQEKSFFPAVSVKQNFIYTFGGYDNIEKVQLKTIESYSIKEDKWTLQEDMFLNQVRSQSSAC